MAAERPDLHAPADPEVLRLTGELDAAGAPALHARLSDLVGRGSGDVRIDVSGLDFIDSVGLGALVKAAGQLERGGRRLRVEGAQGTVLRAIDVTGLKERLAIDD